MAFVLAMSCCDVLLARLHTSNLCSAWESVAEVMTNHINCRPFQKADTTARLKPHSGILNSVELIFDEKPLHIYRPFRKVRHSPWVTPLMFLYDSWLSNQMELPVVSDLHHLEAHLKWPIHQWPVQRIQQKSLQSGNAMTVSLKSL